MTQSADSSKAKVIIEGHEFEPLIFCQFYIFFIPGRIFIKFWSNVWISVIMCRSHDSACWIKVTFEGHKFEL